MKGSLPEVLLVSLLPPPIGGVTVSARQTAQLLLTQRTAKYSQVDFQVRSTGRLRHFTNYVRRLNNCDVVVFQVGNLMKLRWFRTSLYVTCALVLRKPVVYRGAAGGLELGITELPWLWQRIIRLFVSHFAVLTVQTKADHAFLSRWLEGSNVRVVWLPNTRVTRGSYQKAVADKVARRFCYVGSIRSEKGVGLLVDAAKGLPSNIEIDLYGSIGYDLDRHEIEVRDLRCAKVRYCGLADPERIGDVLAEYDALVLPTTWPTEGYPGVVLEAFGAGIPVIATRWNALPELVDSTCGVLIEPGSVDGLRVAISAFCAYPERWRAMCQGAFERSKGYDPELWASQLHEWIVAASRVRAT